MQLGGDHPLKALKRSSQGPSKEITFGGLLDIEILQFVGEHDKAIVFNSNAGEAHQVDQRVLNLLFY